MKRTPLRLLVCPLVLLVVSVTLVCLPVSAQQTAGTSPFAASSNQAGVPSSYNPAVVFAVPKPKPSGGGGSNGPDPSRKWEVEVHGGGMFANNPLGGTSNLPNPGVPFGGSRAESSWYYGDGATLFNTVATAFVKPTITPLNPALIKSVAQRQNGGSFGGRISYEINPRFTAELSLDYSLGEVDLSGQSQIDMAATGNSYVNAFTGLLTIIPVSSIAVSSTPTVHSPDGHQIFFAGALNINLVKHGRAIPYLTLGGGFIHNLGDLPFATLVGNYQFAVAGSSTINETDSIRMHYQASGTSGMGVIGGGVKYYVTPRWGFRLDIRTHLSSNSIDNLLDASPSRVTTTPTFSALFFGGGNSLIFSNDATQQNTLSGPAIANFRTFKGSGVQYQVGVTAGFFYRF